MGEEDENTNDEEVSDEALNILLDAILEDVASIPNEIANLESK